MLTKHIHLLHENREKLRFFFPLCGKVSKFSKCIFFVAYILKQNQALGMK